MFNNHLAQAFSNYLEDKSFCNMTSTSNKPFHTYENVGYDEQANSHVTSEAALTTPAAASNIITKTLATNSSGVAISKTAIETPFPDPMLGKNI